MSLTSDLRSNIRLRIGVALILGIVWLYGLLELRDSNAALLEQHKQVITQLARFGGQQKQTQWPGRAAEARAALVSIESRLWHNSTLGLAQAQLQDWISQQLTQAKAVRSGVKVAESDGGNGSLQKNEKSDAAPADLYRVKAKVEFNADPKVLTALLSAFATAEHQIVVESMNVKLQRVELTLSAWYILQPVTSVPPQPSSGPGRENKT